MEEIGSVVLVSTRVAGPSADARVQCRGTLCLR